MSASGERVQHDCVELLASFFASASYRDSSVTILYQFGLGWQVAADLGPQIDDVKYWEHVSPNCVLAAACRELHVAPHSADTGSARLCHEGSSDNVMRLERLTQFNRLDGAWCAQPLSRVHP